jgi:hypothetical protein
LGRLLELAKLGIDQIVALQNEAVKTSCNAGAPEEVAYAHAAKSPLR